MRVTEHLIGTQLEEGSGMQLYCLQLCLGASCLPRSFLLTIVFGSVLLTIGVFLVIAGGAFLAYNRSFFCLGHFCFRSWWRCPAYLGRILSCTGPNTPSCRKPGRGQNTDMNLYLPSVRKSYLINSK